MPGAALESTEPGGSVRPNSRPLNALLLGGCMLHWPILRTDVHHRILECDVYGRLIEVFTFGEMFQLLALLQETIEIPQALKPLARMPGKFAASARVDNFDAIDVVLVCPSSPIELTFRGIVVNGQCLLRAVMAEIHGGGELGLKLVQHWLRGGLQQLNETVRTDSAAKLLQLIKGGTPAADLARDVIEETRAYPADIGNDLRRLRDLLGRPMGLILYYFRYMRNGRPLSWPAGFHNDLRAAARDLAIPVHDPAPLVVRHGIATALNGQRHYSHAFLPLAGKSIADFAVSVAENRASLGGEPTTETRVAAQRIRIRDLPRLPVSEG